MFFQFKRGTQQMRPRKTSSGTFGAGSFAW
jgi:hypothetical protein